MIITVYASIWLALLLFTIGETGRSFDRHGPTPPRWAWPAFAAGWVVAIVHMFLAFGIIHQWSHADAVADTARLTREMYGVDFGAALYANYVFYAIWLADLWWWRMSPPGYVRPSAATWTLRAIYMLVIFNAAVVFAHGPRRIAGLLLVSWLARIWSRGVLQSRGRSSS